MKKNPINNSNINFLWSSMMIEELVRCGVDYFCLAPGSRCAPLSVAVAQNSRARHFIHFDERGLGFHALGYTSATGKPCAVITTSGTAAANLYPSVIEAAKKKLPLIILTADRPPELRKTGANQTIDQPGMFGSYCRWHFDVPCPTLAIAPEFVLTTIDQAYYQTTAGAAPVHLNCMYREPLAPLQEKIKFDHYLQSIRKWTAQTEPYTVYTESEKTLKSTSLNQIVKSIENIKNGVIAVGKLPDKDTAESVVKLSEKLAWPIFPDITSKLRISSLHPNIIHHYDLILNSNEFLKNTAFDGVVHIGGRMTSKAWYEFAKNPEIKNYITILNHPLRNDPLHKISLRVDSDIARVCQSVTPKLKQRKVTRQLVNLRNATDTAQSAIGKFFKRENKLSEPLIARQISQLSPENSALFLANSMPIREMDMFAAADNKSLKISANRGASGIDGNLATASGFAIGAATAATAVIGDLAFLHDLNSLAILKNVKTPFVLIVVNNNGGGIFSFLPIAEFDSIFEKFFATPHQLNFKSACNMFSIHYTQALTSENFIEAYQKAITKKGATVIEVNTDRKSNVLIHKSLKSEISAAVNQVFQSKFTAQETYKRRALVAK